jgi:8-amino-7-oxononanoate synthase
LSEALPGISDELKRLEEINRRRALTLPRGIDFSSNDYLGLSRHPALREAIIAALNETGMVGAGGSRLLRGHHAAHEALEIFAAQFFGSEKALFMGSGFAANQALFSTLLGRGDAVVFDEYIHASAREGMYASGAARHRARHNDAGSFEGEIRCAREQGARRVLIAVESVYSMDGDFAPLKELDELARRYEAVLVVDEAHATGVLGPEGRGIGIGLQGPHWVNLHTCGKGLGVSGALICAPSEIIDFLINKARPFIYSTAPPPHLASAVKRALELVDEEPWRRERVLALAGLARRRILGEEEKTGGGPIIPLVLGEEARALHVAGELQARGFDVRAVRPPTVPEGTSRLRISIHADHREDDIVALADALRTVMAA